MVDALPQDSLVSEIDSSLSDYDLLLGEASSKWNQNPKVLEDLMNRIAYHESKGDPKAWQVLNDGTYGRGKGLYQFESGKDLGGHTAARRLVNYLGYKPGWLDITKEGVDASKYTPEQQNMLFLANYMKKEQPSSSMMDVTPDNLGEWWAREHWAGQDSLKQKRLDSFDRDMKVYSRKKR